MRRRKRKVKIKNFLKVLELIKLRYEKTETPMMDP